MNELYNVIDKLKEIAESGNDSEDVARAIETAGAYTFKDRLAEAEMAEAHIDEDDMEEGNEFSGALAAARASGSDEFEVDGKKYKVTEDGYEEINQDDIDDFFGGPSDEYEKFAKLNDALNPMAETPGDDDDVYCAQCGNTGFDLANTGEPCPSCGCDTLDDEDSALDRISDRVASREDGLDEDGAKPDYIDLDKDGDTEEPMKQAAKDAEEMDEHCGKGYYESEDPWGLGDTNEYRTEFEFTGDDGETQLGDLFFKVVDGKVDPNSLRGETDVSDPRFYIAKVDDELATQGVQPGELDHEHALAAAQEEYNELNENPLAAMAAGALLGDSEEMEEAVNPVDVKDAMKHLYQLLQSGLDPETKEAVQNAYIELKQKTAGGEA